MANILQSYLDTYEISVSNAQAYKQFGNSVIEAIAKEMRKAMKL
ncbi:hypothetical protein K151_1559 [Proteus hauseri ZMd44]|nr:hypothetical protein K151_1559 [Proteus hauseri ZMd44]